MKEYQIRRKKHEKIATATGLTVTVAGHVCALILVCNSGLKYLDPPLPEESFVLDFIEEVETDPTPEKKGRQPKADEVDLEKPIELIQKSESPNVSQKPNLTPETKPDAFGDVETPAPEPKEEPKLDPRAAFPGMAKKDTTLTAPHSAESAGAKFKAGQPDGNANTAKTEGVANARVKGRNTIGTMPRPSYGSQASGKVVVNIWVNQYGAVQKAVPGGDGTTVTDATLWNAARKAAMETKFNMDAGAPALQEGTITYIFNLK